MKKLLKFGIASLSLTVLAGLSHYQPAVFADDSQPIMIEDPSRDKIYEGSLGVNVYHVGYDKPGDTTPSPDFEAVKPAPEVVNIDFGYGDFFVAKDIPGWKYDSVVMDREWRNEDGVVSSSSEFNSSPDIVIAVFPNDVNWNVTFRYYKDTEEQTPPENQQQPKTITVDLVSKAEDGTVLETSTQDWIVTPENPYGTLATFIPGYRLIGNTSFELTYDQVQDGERVLVEFMYQPDEKAQKKTITVEKVGKTEDGTVLDTSTDTFWLFPYGGGDRHIYGATHLPGYRVSHFTRQEVTYDEVEDGDKVVLEAIYKPVDPNKLDEDALTFTIKPIDGNFNPLPLEPKTMVIYPDEMFIPRADTTPVYPGYEFKGSFGVATYELIKDSIARDASFTYPVIYSPVEPKEELKNKTITIIEERQDEEGRVIFKKEHVFNLKPHQEERLPLDQTVDQLIRGSNIASWDAYDDAAVIHFTTRRRPKAAEPKSQTIYVNEERQDENGQVIFTKKHTIVIKEGDPDYVIPYDPETELLLRGSGGIVRYGNFVDNAELPFVTRKKPKVVLPEKRNDAGEKTNPVEPTPVPAPKSSSTPAPKDLAADRNKLLLSVDESGLTDQQKGELAIKITFAETEKDLADLKAELVKLVKAAEKPANKPAKEAPKTESKASAAAAKPAANAPAKSDKAALPATGDVTRVGLIAAGFSLLLLGLGLAKSRKHN